MAIINDPNIAAQIAALAASGQIDTTVIVDLINQSLPPGQQLSTGAGVATGVYKNFGQFDKINARVEVVTTGMWTGDEGSLSNAYTSSVQVLTQDSADYYYNVYNVDPMGASSDSAEVQYAVAYGHVNGSGSVSLQNDDNALLASKATYAQYKSILLDPTDTKFSFQNSSGVLTH